MHMSPVQEAARSSLLSLGDQKWRFDKLLASVSMTSKFLFLTVAAIILLKS